MLIVPDIHGRNFWKEPLVKHFTGLSCSANLDKDFSTNEFGRKVVFLGDYLDPYSHEGISVVTALDMFKQILSLKKDHLDDIILLLGNHDWSYIRPDKFYTSRHDSFFEGEAHSLFVDNMDLFQMVYLCDVNDQHYVLSHAGIHPEWMDMYLKVDNINDVAELYNLPADKISSQRLDLLNCISYKRGGSASVGSMTWCDVEEFESLTLTPDFYQIFGHTQQIKDPIITNSYACIDCRKVFELTKNGKLLSYI